jgi:hypothetical protein
LQQLVENQVSVDSWEVKDTNIDCGTTQEETLPNEIMEICIQRIGTSKDEKDVDHHHVDVHECLDTRLLVQDFSVSQKVIEVRSARGIVTRNFVSNPKECAPKKMSISETLLNLAQPNDKKPVHEKFWGSSSGHSVKTIIVDGIPARSRFRSPTMRKLLQATTALDDPDRFLSLVNMTSRLLLRKIWNPGIVLNFKFWLWTTLMDC